MEARKSESDSILIHERRSRTGDVQRIVSLAKDVAASGLSLGIVLPEGEPDPEDPPVNCKLRSGSSKESCASESLSSMAWLRSVRLPKSF